LIDSIYDFTDDYQSLNGMVSDGKK